MNPLDGVSQQSKPFVNTMDQRQDDGVDPLDWDPTDPKKKNLKKPTRRYSFEHPSASKRSVNSHQ